MSCRKALEALERVLTENTVDLKKQFGSESKAGYVDGIRKRLKEFLNMGAHSGSTITRRDADFALLQTKSLLAYVGSAAYPKSS